jgi:hypothetical protein
MQALIADYMAGPELLRQAVAGMSPEQLAAKPIAGKWSTLEVVCHLADFDPILANRMKQIIAFDQPVLMGIDENSYASFLCYADRQAEEEIAVISSTRAQMSRILGKLPDATLERVGLHNERGALSLERMLTISIRHIIHHTGFIADKKKALGIT